MALANHVIIVSSSNGPYLSLYSINVRAHMRASMTLCKSSASMVSIERHAPSFLRQPINRYGSDIVPFAHVYRLFRMMTILAIGLSLDAVRSVLPALDKTDGRLIVASPPRMTLTTIAAPATKHSSRNVVLIYAIRILLAVTMERFPPFATVGTFISDAAIVANRPTATGHGLIGPLRTVEPEIFVHDSQGYALGTLVTVEKLHSLTPFMVSGK